MIDADQDEARYGLPIVENMRQGSTDSRRLLSVRDLCVTFAEKTILDSVAFDLDEAGSTVVIGPVGAGKSTLLRTLAGHLEGVHGFASTGLLDRGEELERRPAALVSQSARLLMRTVFENLASGLRDRSSLTLSEQRETVRALLTCYELEALVPHLDESVVTLSLGRQRLIAIARCLAADPALLLVDEPTSGLDELERSAIVALLRSAARERHVVCITHNRKDALELAGNLLFIVDGQLIERRPVPEFFERPATPEGALYAETGSCLGISSRPPKRETAPPPGPRAPIPTGFHWIRKGSLAGVTRPGLLADLDQDLRGLAALGIRTLVCLEEKRTISDEQARAYGLEMLHFPIVDMEAPCVSSGLRLCETLHERLQRGDRMAVHCRAGLGRTGTVLCALLIYEGLSALDALDTVRRVQWKFVQSEAQVSFLSALELRVAGARAELHQ